MQSESNLPGGIRMIDNRAKRRNPRNIFMYAGIDEAEFQKVRPIMNIMNYNIWFNLMKHMMIVTAAVVVLCLCIPEFKNDLSVAIIFILVGVYNTIIMKIIPPLSSYYRFHYISEFIILITASMVGSCINHSDFPLFCYFGLYMIFISAQFIVPYIIFILSSITGLIFALLMYIFGNPEYYVSNICILILGTVVLCDFCISISVSKIGSLTNASLQVDELNEEKAKSQRHISALASLSREYGTIWYADLSQNIILDVYATETDNYGANVIGSKISEVIQKYCDDKVYVEDSLNVKGVISLDNIRQNLDAHNSVSVRYRINENGQELYYEMKVIQDKAGEGRLPIIIAIRNVDVEVRLDMVFKANYDQARQSATKDIMTGVKNKTAYEWKCQELFEEIKVNENKEFAIVMCDVNGLKKINDTFGHDSGDKLIKEVCKIISTIYTHSPVYRVGGDEFVIILEDVDYKNREYLFSEARKQAVDNEENVSFACGMAVFDKEKDDDIVSVYKRADSEMYNNKKQMKAERED